MILINDTLIHFFDLLLFGLLLKHSGITFRYQCGVAILPLGFYEHYCLWNNIDILCRQYCRRKVPYTITFLMLLSPLQFGFAIHANRLVQKSDYIDVEVGKSEREAENDVSRSYKERHGVRDRDLDLDKIK